MRISLLILGLLCVAFCNPGLGMIVPLGSYELEFTPTEMMELGNIPNDCSKGCAINVFSTENDNRIMMQVAPCKPDEIDIKQLLLFTAVYEAITEKPMGINQETLDLYVGKDRSLGSATVDYGKHGNKIILVVWPAPDKHAVLAWAIQWDSDKEAVEMLKSIRVIP